MITLPRWQWRLLIVIGLTLIVAGGVIAAVGLKKPLPSFEALVQGVPEPPSELEHAQVTNDAQKLQLIQVQMQVLNYQFEQTKTSLQGRLKALEKDGYQLDVESWTYVKRR